MTLVETVVATLLVGGACAAAVRVVGASEMHRFRHRSQDRGVRLAAELLDEVLAKPYDDPDGAAVILGLDFGELGATQRSGFDDVNDYHQWSASPPVDEDGAARPGFDATWTRTVVVRNVEDDGTTVAAYDSGVQRVTVTVRRRGLVVAELAGWRSRAADAAAEDA